MGGWGDAHGLLRGFLTRSGLDFPLASALHELLCLILFFRVPRPKPSPWGKIFFWTEAVRGSPSLAKY